MKLSIWQQFSSNHSAGFEVVGIFETITEAEKARDALKAIVKMIGDYYRKAYTNDDDFYQAMSSGFFTLSDTEKQIKQQYQADDWNTGLDWTYTDQPDRVVSQFENLVIIANRSETWTGYPPFDVIMKSLGGDIAVGMEGWKQTLLTIKCNAPDGEIAEKIVNALADNHPFGGDAIIHNTIIYKVKVPALSESFYAKIDHSGNAISVSEIMVGISSTPEYDTTTFIIGLKNYLTNKGCINFEYQLEERL